MLQEQKFAQHTQHWISGGTNSEIYYETIITMIII